MGDFPGICRAGDRNGSLPMLWPIRNSGTDDGNKFFRKASISSSTRDVGPVSPFSEGFVTDRPHPLSMVSTIAWAYNSKNRVNYLRLIKGMHFDTLGSQSGEESAVEVACGNRRLSNPMLSCFQ
jgi:hypothetical protein